MAFAITHARFPEQPLAVREILREYARSLNFELCFQSFEEELVSLPGRYAPPCGRCLLASDGQALGGVIALRDLGDRICEMKRLYVRPACRGTGLGLRLARTLIDEARGVGYRAMRLDTVPQMTDAIRLYLGLGFRDVPPYCPNPIAGARFMALTLSAPA